MRKIYKVRVTETVDHSYLIEANDAEEAVDKFYSYTDEELKSLDLDGNISWDSPWEVEEMKDVTETGEQE